MKDTAVVATTASGRGLRRDARVDPFVYRGKYHVTPTVKSPTPSSTGGSSGTSSTGSGSTGASSAGSSGGSPSAFGPTSSPRATAPTYKTASIKVRFGRVENDRGLRTVPRLAALPSVDHPVLIFLGIAKGTHTGVFLVSSDAHAEGDGRCKPSAASCQTVWVKEGQTEFFDVTSDTGAVAQYQLDVVDVKYSRTSSKAKAAASFLKTTKPTKPLSPKATAKKLAAAGAGDAATTHLPLLTDLEWSSTLGRVLGVPAPKKDDTGHGTPSRPVVVPTGSLDEITLRAASQP